MKDEEHEGSFGEPQTLFKRFSLHVNSPENYCSLNAFSVFSTA